MKHTMYAASLPARNFPALRIGRLLAVASILAASPIANAQTAASSSACQVVPSSSDAYGTAFDYVTTFYPRWFTYNQSKSAQADQLLGPDKVTPLYQTVVAVNVDTLYASSYLDLSSQPAILTIPTAPNPSQISFSVLILDQYGQVLSQGMTFSQGTTYALTGPQGYYGAQGALPSGAATIQLPVTHPSIIFRVDKNIGGTDVENAAASFRQSLRLQPLSDYQTNAEGGTTNIVPESTYAPPLKLATDAEIALLPMDFLNGLMQAVAAPNTQPLTAEESTLAANLNALVAAGDQNAALASGVQAAHDQINLNYLNNRDRDQWVHFTNIGAWTCTASDILDRASITEFLQYGNDLSAASYFHAFRDGNGNPLNGGTGGSYSITFTKDQLPQAKRFWSITAYTPETIELVPNLLNKYEIARYTPGLVYNSDGSLTLYFAVQKPLGVPAANYLPIPPSDFNLLLRVYGPEGNTTNPDYMPPAVQHLN